MSLGLTDFRFYFVLLLDILHLDRLVRLGDLELPISLATHTRQDEAKSAIPSFQAIIIQYR